MKDSTKLAKLNKDLEELIKKYRVEYMSDAQRLELRNKIEDTKNAIKCMQNMY